LTKLTPYHSTTVLWKSSNICSIFSSEENFANICLDLIKLEGKTFLRQEKKFSGHFFFSCWGQANLLCITIISLFLVSVLIGVPFFPRIILCFFPLTKDKRNLNIRNRLLTNIYYKMSLIVRSMMWRYTILLRFFLLNLVIY